VVFTRVEMERSADPQKLAQKMVEPIDHRVIPDPRAALRTLLVEAQADDMIVVAGSLYLLGEVRPMLEELAAAPTAGARTTQS
jgi:folylpolyglutamate synthase/dihydropteroate synthase